MSGVLFIVGTTISIIAMVFTVLSFQFKSKKVYLIFQTIGTVLFTTSYFFLGAGIGAILNIIFILRNFLFMIINTQTQKKAAYIACSSLCVLYIATYVIYYFCIGKTFTPAEYVLGFLPMLGAIPGTMCLLQTSPNKIRYWKFPDHVCWLIYNITCFSVGGTLCEIFNIISNVISCFRFKKVE